MWITILIVVGSVLIYTLLWAWTSALLNAYLDMEYSEALMAGFIVPLFLPIGLAAYFYYKFTKWIG